MIEGLSISPAIISLRPPIIVLAFVNKNGGLGLGAVKNIRGDGELRLNLGL